MKANTVKTFALLKHIWK